MSAAWIDAAMGGVVSLAGAAMLVLGLLAFVARRAATAVGFATAQAGCLAAALAAEAWLQVSWPLLAVAGFTVAAKQVALPLALRALLAVAPEPGRPEVFRPAVAAVALAGLILAIVAPLCGNVIAMALAVAALGGLAMAMRRDDAGQVAGVLALENGLVLAIGAQTGLPAAPLLVLAAAALPVAAVVVLWHRMMPPREGA